MYAYKVLKMVQPIQDPQAFEKELIDLDLTPMWISNDFEQVDVPRESLRTIEFLHAQLLYTYPRDYSYYERDPVSKNTVLRAATEKVTSTTHLFFPFKDTAYAFLVGKARVDERDHSLQEAPGYAVERNSLSSLVEPVTYNISTISSQFSELWTTSFVDGAGTVRKGTVYGNFQHDDEDLSVLTINATTKAIGVKVVAFGKEYTVRVYADGRIQVIGMQKISEPKNLGIILHIANLLSGHERQ